jgi:hypothetical protein
VKEKPLIDELLEDYLPKRYYGHEARKHAKEMALKFWELARQECAMNDMINGELFLGREYTKEEKDRILRTWGFDGHNKGRLMLKNYKTT